MRLTRGSAHACLGRCRLTGCSTHAFCGSMAGQYSVAEGLSNVSTVVPQISNVVWQFKQGVMEVVQMSPLDSAVHE
ncbi:hypothetical protein UPYG_G00027630 [Umbra pygmaea]|uniref:Uncharacterized protein n=1 Tax=Umbra pygmaea TaxID=75934 RepID=A0ABD0XP40_UMBPY